MAIKEYFTPPRSLALEPHCETQFRFIPKGPFLRNVTTLQGIQSAYANNHWWSSDSIFSTVIMFILDKVGFLFGFGVFFCLLFSGGVRDVCIYLKKVLRGALASVTRAQNLNEAVYLEKIWIHRFSLNIWVNNRAEWAL